MIMSDFDFRQELDTLNNDQKRRIGAAFVRNVLPATSNSSISAIIEIAANEKINNAKAALLYAEIDRNPLFKGAAAVEDRSNMNATFLLNDEAHTATFDAMWKAAGISGLPGHRSVGGYRASMYNALPLESVQVLVDVMKELESKI